MIPKLDQKDLLFDINFELEIFINLENIDYYAVYLPNGTLNLFQGNQLLNVYKSKTPLFILNKNFGFSKNGEYFYFLQESTLSIQLYNFNNKQEINYQCQNSYYKILMNQYIIAQEDKQILNFINIYDKSILEFQKQKSDEFEIEDVTKTNKFIVIHNKQYILLLQYTNYRIVIIQKLYLGQTQYINREKIIQCSELNLFYIKTYNAPIRQYSIQISKQKLIRKFNFISQKLIISNRNSNEIIVFYQQATRKQNLLVQINLCDGKSEQYRITEYKVENHEGSDFILIDQTIKNQKESTMKQVVNNISQKHKFKQV